MCESDGFRTNLRLTSLLLRPAGLILTVKGHDSGKILQCEFEGGTGVPPVNHAQDARATLKSEKFRCLAKISWIPTPLNPV
jgi:hypothetical protein